NRMALRLFVDGGILSAAPAEMTVLRIRSGVGRIAVVGVDDVARGAAAAAVVAGLVVGAAKVERRIEQARALDALEDGIAAGEGAEAPIAETVIAPLEDAQDVAGLCGFELRKGPQLGQPAAVLGLVRGGRRRGGKPLRFAVARVSFA